MIPIYKNKRNIRIYKLRKLLPKINTGIIGDNLFTKLTIQKGQEIKVEIKKRRKLLKDTRKHLERKQDTFLQSRTLTYHKNRRIGPHYECSTSTKERTINIQIEDHKSNRTKLRDFRKRNVNDHPSSQRMEKISREYTTRSKNRHELQEPRIF